MRHTPRTAGFRRQGCGHRGRARAHRQGQVRGGDVEQQVVRPGDAPADPPRLHWRVGRGYGAPAGVPRAERHLTLTNLHHDPVLRALLLPLLPLPRPFLFAISIIASCLLVLL